MAILSKRGILNAIDKGDLAISPFHEDQLNPNSYDIRIGDQIAYYVLTDANFPTMQIQFGMLEQYMMPNVYGHAAALRPDDPNANVTATLPVFDLAQEQHSVQETIPEYGLVIYPGNVYCAWTDEEITCNRVIAELSGKSSIARSGVTIHNTAGYSNIGHKFKYVVEITCTYPTMIYPHMKIGQIIFHEIDSLYNPEDTYTGVYAEVQHEDAELIKMYVPDPMLTERAEAAQDILIAQMEEEERQRQLAEEEVKRKNRITTEIEEKYYNAYCNIKDDPESDLDLSEFYKLYVTELESADVPYMSEDDFLHVLLKIPNTPKVEVHPVDAEVPEEIIHPTEPNDTELVEGEVVEPDDSFKPVERLTPEEIEDVTNEWQTNPVGMMNSVYGDPNDLNGMNQMDQMQSGLSAIESMMSATNKVTDIVANNLEDSIALLEDIMDASGIEYEKKGHSSHDKN